MMFGTNDCEKRKEVFELIANCYEDTYTMQMINNSRWIRTFVDMKSEVMLGVSQKGEWIFKDKDKIYILDEKKMFLYCAKLIEVPYEIIQEYIYDNFKEIISMKSIGISDIFPFYEIVEFIFNNFFDDYWIDLAWLWYIQLELQQQKQLVGILLKISKVKKISQRNRQKIKKEVERVIKIANIVN